MFDFLAKLFAWPLTFFYEITGNYLISIMMITLLVMAVTTPLTLKSTKGMLEMQRLQPEMRRLQQQHRGDRQTLNQEMMKLYQEHKVNPLASCLPLLLQMPVFIGMFTLLRGLTKNRDPDGTFAPTIISTSSQLYKDLDKSTEMVSFGLDLALSPVKMVQEDALKGLLYVLFVIFLGFMYWFQQRMIANRSATATMSATQAKIMQYLPVAFAPMNLFFQLGLVMYYLTSTVLRIGQQTYITRRFYHGDHSLGRQAQAASKEARDISKSDKPSPATKPGTAKSGNGRPTPGAKTGPASSKPASKPTPKPAPKGAATPPKGKPTPSGRVPKTQAPKAQPAKPSPPKAGAAASKPRPTKPVKPVKPTKPTAN